jgi:hypothetical protein
VSVLATPDRLDAGSRGARPATLGERLAAALPLASIYLWLSIVYLVEAWGRVTPWLFGDELELTQLSRSIAATGRAARRGQPHSPDSIYTYLTAPMWWLHSVQAGYSGVKYLDVLLMTSVVFPAYFLARLVVRRPWALFAAAGAGAIPSLAYSSYIVEETVAYPYAALCLFLIAKALIGGVRWPFSRWAWAAIVASLLAPLVRGELVVMPIAFGFALLAVAWSSSWGRRRRAAWSLGDWLGVGVLAAGLAIFVSGLLSNHYFEWQVVTRAYKHRIFVLGDWAVGALAIGIGVLPLVLGLAALFRAPGEEPEREVRMFRATAFGGLLAFGLYAGMKGAYLSTIFATRIEERNLIYIAPLLFAGTALVLERRRVAAPALVAAAAYAAYLVVGTPYQMDRQLYSDALGLAIVEQANRYLGWTPTYAQAVLLTILVVGTVLTLVAATLRERARVTAALAAVLALAVVGWNVTAEIAAAAGTNSISRTDASTLRHPLTWVDDVAHRRPTLYLAQGVADPTPEWLLEFWNRSIVTVSSIDGTLGGPGPAGAPNVTADGKLFWTENPATPGREYAYAVEDWPCIDFAGTYRGKHAYRAGGGYRVWRLIQLTQPNRLLAQCSGIYPDGWSGPQDSTYFRFSSGASGWLRITLSRGGYPASPVTVQFGTIGERDLEPALGVVSQKLRVTIPRYRTGVIWVHTPASAFGAKVVVAKKFVPALSGGPSGDRRTLGVQVGYTFHASLPRNVHCRRVCVFTSR